MGLIDQRSYYYSPSEDRYRERFTPKGHRRVYRKDKWFTVQEAANYFKVSRWCIQIWCDKGALLHHKDYRGFRHIKKLEAERVMATLMGMQKVGLSRGLSERYTLPGLKYKGSWTRKV